MRTDIPPGSLINFPLPDLNNFTQPLHAGRDLFIRVHYLAAQLLLRLRQFSFTLQLGGFVCLKGGESLLCGDGGHTGFLLPVTERRAVAATHLTRGRLDGSAEESASI